MTETEFLARIAMTFLRIEDALEKSGLDVDCEGGDGLLKLIFPNGAQIVLNKQAPIKQLWLAGKSQGYHFNDVEGEWICDRSKRTFVDIFNEVVSEAAQQPVNLL